MRRIIFGLFVALLFSFALISAAESYDIDFTQSITQPAYLHKGDEVRFQLLGGDHALVLTDVGKNSVKIGLVPFTHQGNGTKIFETVLGLDYILKLDLDKDGTPDLNVALYSVSDTGEVHLVLQDAKAESAAEAISPTGDVGLVGQTPVGSGLSIKMISLIVIGIIILGLGLFFFFRKGKKEVSETKSSEIEPVEQHADLPKEQDSS